MKLPSLSTQRRIRYALWCLSGDASNRLYPLALDAWRNGCDANEAAFRAVVLGIVQSASI